MALSYLLLADLIGEDAPGQSFALFTSSASAHLAF